MMMGVFGLGGGELVLVSLLGLFIIPFSLAFVAFWIWMLIHAAQNKGLNNGERIAWVVIIALLHFLGALIYFFVGKPKGKTPLSSAA